MFKQMWFISQVYCNNEKQADKDIIHFIGIPVRFSSDKVI